MCTTSDFKENSFKLNSSQQLVSICRHSRSEELTCFFFFSSFFFSSFPAPFQLHLSSLTEKVWNRLKVRPQNKEPWHVLKSVWDTHTQWAQKGKLCSKKPLCSLLDISNFLQFNCTAHLMEFQYVQNRFLSPLWLGCAIYRTGI